MTNGLIEDCAMPSSPAATSAAARRKWTREEDDILRLEAELQSKDGCPSDWKRIAMRIPGRSNKDCRKRWNKICTRINKGAWNGEEDEALRQAVLQHGCRWAQVAQVVRTRNAEQCAKRWHHSLDPDVDRSEWSQDDDACLMEAITKYGKSWKTIAERAFPRRSTTDIKNRYSIITRRRGQRPQSTPGADASETPSREGSSSPDDLGMLIDPTGPSMSSNSSLAHFDAFSFSLSSPEMTEEGGYPTALAVADDSAMVGLDTGLDQCSPQESALDGLTDVDPYLNIQPDLDTYNVLPWELDDAYSGQATSNLESNDILPWEGEFGGIAASTITIPQEGTGADCGSVSASDSGSNASNKSLKVTLQLEGASSTFLHRMLGMLLESQTQFKIEADSGEPMSLG